MVVWTSGYYTHGNFHISYFAEDGRSGAFVIGNDRFPASLLDLPGIVESYKTYDDNVLIKTADIGQVQYFLSLLDEFVPIIPH